MIKKKFTLKKYCSISSFDRWSLYLSAFTFVLAFSVILIIGIPENITMSFTILVSLMLIALLYFIVTLLVVIIRSMVLIIKRSIRARNLP